MKELFFLREKAPESSLRLLLRLSSFSISDGSRLSRIRQRLPHTSLLTSRSKLAVLAHDAHQRAIDARIARQAFLLLQEIRLAREVEKAGVRQALADSGEAAPAAEAEATESEQQPEA